MHAVACKLASPPLPKINLNVLPAEEAKAISLAGYAALGRGFYGKHSREIMEDGPCVLRQGDEVIWKRRCISKAAERLTLEGNLGHKLEGDVLNIEGLNKARRK